MSNKPTDLDIVQIKDSDCYLKISDTIWELEKDWSSLAHDNIYAMPEYLALLERKGPLSYSYCYALLYKEDKAVAAVYFQMKRIELIKDFRVHSHSNSLYENLKVFLMKQLFKRVNQNILICGNVLLTGEYAFGTNYGFQMDAAMLDTIIDKVIDHFKEKRGIKIQGVLSKDFYESGKHKEISFDIEDFTEFRVQPDMIMEIDEAWESYDDYLAAVRSKYRVKFKKVMKKAETLEFRELDLEALEQYNDDMYTLYKSTADRASFSLFNLDPKYFLELKRSLGDKIRITAIFEKERLVGFYTFVINKEYGDAHFIGYDVKLNSKYQIYFNILLGLVKKAIESDRKFLNLSRTALEIKSSVGAEAHEMFIYLRSQNSFINSILGFILDRVVPKNSWQPRSPFK